jgi:hypothetical protein
MTVNRDDIDHKIRWLRARAEEVRTAAEGMQHARSRESMLHIARTYEKMASHLEEVLAHVRPTG